MKLAVGTIRLVPPRAPAIARSFDDDEDPEGGGITRTSSLHDGREPYIKLGRLATLKEYRRLGLARMLLNAALEWASQHPATIMPPASPATKEAARIERGSTPTLTSGTAWCWCTPSCTCNAGGRGSASSETTAWAPGTRRASSTWACGGGYR